MLLAHKRNADAVIARLTALYERRSGGQIFAAFQPPSRALAEFKRSHAAGPCGYPDPAERIAFWDALLAERAELEDDSIPSAYLSEFDQGLYGGLIGGDVRFTCDADTGWVSSMVAPLLADWSQLPQVRFSPDSPWLARYDGQLQAFAAAARGRFGVSHLICINGLNFVFELVGATETYMGLLERPDEVRAAIALGLEVNRAVQERFFERVPRTAGGTCGFGVQWLPGRVISESVDPFHMTSVEYFETWGRSPCERMFERFDGGVTHLHGNGRHLLEAVCTLRGLKAIHLGDDKGWPAAIDVLADLRRRAGDMPLTAGVEFADFAARLARRELPGGVLYLVRNAPSVSEANRLMDRVRAYWV